MSATGTGGPPTITEVNVQFKAEYPIVLLTIMRPGKYWNPLVGWEDMPADGKPTADQKFTPTRFATVGLDADKWEVKLPVDLDQMERASLGVYSADAAGNLLKSIGWYPIEILPDEPQTSENDMYLLKDISISGTITKP